MNSLLETEHEVSWIYKNTPWILWLLPSFVNVQHKCDQTMHLWRILNAPSKIVKLEPKLIVKLHSCIIKDIFRSQKVG